VRVPSWGGFFMGATRLGKWERLPESQRGNVSARGRDMTSVDNSVNKWAMLTFVTGSAGQTRLLSEGGHTMYSTWQKMSHAPRP
jgi:hypothetical protein